MSFHKVILVGNLGRDPETRYTPKGAKVVSFSVASNRQYKNSEEETVKEVIWFRINVWGSAGDACAQYLHKGSMVLVEGRLIADKETGGPRTYERQDGSGGASFEVSAETVRFLGGAKPVAEGEAGQAGAGPAPAAEEEIPF